MVGPNNMHRIFAIMILLLFVQPAVSQITQDTSKSDNQINLSDSNQIFHRKKGDVINYFLVDNFNNPSLAGSLKSYQAQVRYENQLPGGPNNHQYGEVMLDMFLGKKQGRHGLAYRLKIGHVGFTNTIRQRIDYSFQCLNKKNYSIRVGVGVGFLMEQHVKADLTWGDMIDHRYGFIYNGQDSYSLIMESAAFQVSKIHWNIGSQIRILNGYINVFYNHNVMDNIPHLGAPNRWSNISVNTFYNFDFKIMQLIPSFELSYFAPELYKIQGGIFMASNTSKGGGGGITYNNHNIMGITGLFAWNDYLRLIAQVQIPFSDIRLSYPVSNFQLTLSYKINDISKYE
jgi:Type IX secretion system membrane protein PorP/SprF